MTICSHATSEVADKMMGCSERWLIEQLRANRFPGRKVGRHWRMTEADVQEALDICANSASRGTPRQITSGLGLTPTSRRKLVGT